MDQLPSEFGVSAATTGSSTSVYDQYLFKQAAALKGDDSEDDEDEDSDEDDEDDLPITHKFTLSHSNSPILSLKFSPSGNSVVVTSADSTINIYNFPSMNPISTSPLVTREELKAIHTISINSNSQILALADDFAFKVLSDEAKTIKEFQSGDRYIYDVKQTKGHIGALTHGVWLPKNKILTSSADSTFRIWDYETGKQEQVVSIKRNGKKVKVLQVLKSIDEKFIIASNDSKIVSIWNVSNFNRPVKELEFSHNVLSIATNTKDENLLLVRTSNELKLYDLRNLSSPIIQKLDFPTTTIKTHKSSLVFTENHIYLPVNSKLLILDKSDLYTIKALQFSSNITSLHYSEKLDQILIGLNSGEVEILFNPNISKNGVLLTLKNKPKKKEVDDSKFVNVGKEVGYNMSELQEFNKTKKRKVQLEDDDDEI